MTLIYKKFNYAKFLYFKIYESLLIHKSLPRNWVNIQLDVCELVRELVSNFVSDLHVYKRNCAFIFISKDICESYLCIYTRTLADICTCICVHICVDIPFVICFVLCCFVGSCNSHFDGHKSKVKMQIMRQGADEKLS